MASNDLHLAASRYHVRPATKDDAADMTDVFFHSFTQPFWRFFVPKNEAFTKWLTDAWQMGVDNPTDRTFVVEDTEKSNKIVAFSRWMVPQEDGILERQWPDISPETWNMELVESFFGGMEANREDLMGKRPHWLLDMLAVHEDYQKQGIGASLIKWGTDQADRDSLETYVDSSPAGEGNYRKRHGFGAVEKNIDIPDRPEYGPYYYISLIRLPAKAS